MSTATGTKAVTGIRKSWIEDRTHHLLNCLLDKPVNHGGNGKRLLKYVKAMFATIHRQDSLTEIGFKRLMNKHKKAIMKTVRRFVPEHKKSAALAKRFAEHGESYFLFVEDTKIAPTN